MMADHRRGRQQDTIRLAVPQSETRVFHDRGYALRRGATARHGGSAGALVVDDYASYNALVLENELLRV